MTGNQLESLDSAVEGLSGETRAAYYQAVTGLILTQNNITNFTTDCLPERY
jgi:hypothetical protein